MSSYKDATFSAYPGGGWLGALAGTGVGEGLVVVAVVVAGAAAAVVFVEDAATELVGISMEGGAIVATPGTAWMIFVAFQHQFALWDIGSCDHLAVISASGMLSPLKD